MALPPMTSTRMSLPPASLMYSRTRMFMWAGAERLNDGLADAAVSARITPRPCVPSSSLMTQGVPPTSLITSSARRGSLGKGDDPQADALARQQLQGAQLVAGRPDGNAFVEREDALHFELPGHRESIASDGGADARDHRIIVGEHAPTAPMGRLGRGDVHVPVGIDHVYGRSADTNKARGARERDEFQLQASSPRRTSYADASDAAARAGTPEHLGSP